MKNLGGLHAFSFCVRQDYEELEKQLKQVFKERSTILRQLTKTSRELDGIKTNLQVRWKLIFSAAKCRESPGLSQWIDTWRLPHFFFLQFLKISLALNMGVIIYYYMSFEKKCFEMQSKNLGFAKSGMRNLCAWQSHQFLTASKINLTPVFFILQNDEKQLWPRVKWIYKLFLEGNFKFHKK